MKLVIAASFLWHCLVRVWCLGWWQPPCQPKEKARTSESCWPNTLDGSALKPPGSRLSWYVIIKCLCYFNKFILVFKQTNKTGETQLWWQNQICDYLWGYVDQERSCLGWLSLWKFPKQSTYDLCIYLLLCHTSILKGKRNVCKNKQKYQRLKKKTDSILAILLPK